LEKGTVFSRICGGSSFFFWGKGRGEKGRGTSGEGKKKNGLFGKLGTKKARTDRQRKKAIRRTLDGAKGKRRAPSERGQKASS